MGIHGLIKSDNKYLVIKRAEDDEFDAGCWDLPGGGISPREKIEETFIREVLEEVGLKIIEINVLGAYELEDTSLQFFVLAALTEGETVTTSHEHSEYRWVSEQELFKLSPAGIHIKAARYFLKNNTPVAKYSELVTRV